MDPIPGRMDLDVAGIGGTADFAVRCSGIGYIVSRLVDGALFSAKEAAVGDLGSL